MLEARGTAIEPVRPATIAAARPGAAVEDSFLDRGTIRARFLRGIQSDIASFILPELAGGDAIERAHFMNHVIDRLAAEDDVFGPALALLAADYVALAGTDQPAATPAARIRALRVALTAIVRGLPLLDDAAAIALRMRIIDLERRWSDAISAAPLPTSTGPSVYDRVTPASVTAWLRANFPSSPAIRATEVEILAGGRSKKTIFLKIMGTRELPTDLVMRQDTGLGHIGTSIATEAPVLGSAAVQALPVPAVHHVELSETALGGPFMLMRRMPGSKTGDYPAFDGDATPALLDDIARALARLHAIEPGAIGLDDAQAGRPQNERLRDLVDASERQWRAMAIEPSPLVECGFDWVRRRCERPLPGGAIVHGDYRPHNFLAVDGRLSAILDWEFAHIGDPAEDLAYIRPTILPIMPWESFMASYRDAGGRDCDDEALRLYDIWGTVRLAALGAGAVRGYMDGSSDDFCQGAGGFFVIPPFERHLAALLGDAPEAPRS